MNKRNRTRVLAGAAMLTAVSFVLHFLEFPVPLAPAHMKMDISDMPALIGAFAYGPWWGVAIEAVKSLADASGRTLALADPAPMAEVSSLDSSAIALTVRAWCRTADYWDVFFGGNQAVKQAFDKAGVAIPFPQMDVHIKQA